MYTQKLIIIQNFLVNFRDGSTDYDATKTTTIFRAYHFEDGSGGVGPQYQTDHDLAQSTGFQKLAQGMANDNDQCVAGILHLFDPSSTTFVKHFLCETAIFILIMVLIDGM